MLILICSSMNFISRLSPHQSATTLRLFRIDNTTGDLTSIQSLLSLPDQVYNIIVEASDMGDQPLTSQTFVHVHVLDVGNSQPVIKVNLLSGTATIFILTFKNNSSQLLFSSSGRRPTELFLTLSVYVRLSVMHLTKKY